MYRVQYLCPRQGPYWQRGKAPPIMTLQDAINWAEILKPPLGSARVLDPLGRVVYQC